MESVHPDVKPYKAAKTMSGAFDRAGSQMARVKMALKRVWMIIILKTPYMSPSWAGTILPNVLRLVSIALPILNLLKTHDAAFTIGTK